MSATDPGFELEFVASEGILAFRGDWRVAGRVPAFADLEASLAAGCASMQADGAPCRAIRCRSDELAGWDSAFMAVLLHLRRYCDANGLVLDVAGLPEGARRLLALATAVSPHLEPVRRGAAWWRSLHPGRWLARAWTSALDFLRFLGEVALGLGRLLRGTANTRRVDFLDFCHQAGPAAFAIITLTSVLVGMIVAYLGSVQLQQLGAQLYVADLVVVGMLREMGALMTAVVMAGRTGAAYAAQLGTMQTNDEIDALTTLGVSPVEFLVLPRMLALVVIMPLLVVYSNCLGVFGGAVVAISMDVSFIQFASQAREAITFEHLAVGLFKSAVFAALIALAGCRAGMQSGRSSAAVGQAATTAVVTAVVYLIIADAAINILCQELDI